MLKPILISCVLVMVAISSGCEFKSVFILGNNENNRSIQDLVLPCIDTVLIVV